MLGGQQLLEGAAEEAGHVLEEGVVDDWGWEGVGAGRGGGTARQAGRQAVEERWEGRGAHAMQGSQSTHNGTRHAPATALATTNKQLPRSSHAPVSITSSSSTTGGPPSAPDAPPPSCAAAAVHIARAGMACWLPAMLLPPECTAAAAACRLLSLVKGRSRGPAAASGGGGGSDRLLLLALQLNLLLA